MKTALKRQVQKPSKSDGFSLVELLVSMALFIVVLTMGVGALMVLISANAKAQNMQAAVSNVQFALDSMSREIRTGYGYYCSANPNDNITGDISQTNDCDTGSGGVYLSIIEGGESITQGATNKRIAYRYNSTDQSIERKKGSGSWTSFTDPNVKITNMHFNVANTDNKVDDSNMLQPNATIYIVGNVTGVGNTSASFTLQTTVTRRVLDL